MIELWGECPEAGLEQNSISVHFHIKCYNLFVIDVNMNSFQKKKK